MESLKHKLSSSDAKEEVSFPKRTRCTVDLPPEVWELIFRNLSGYWLRTVRLTCSSWNQIIRGSSRLMAKFVLTLKTDNFTHDRKLVRNLLAMGGGYTRAKMELVKIGIHRPRDNWLKPLGTTLVVLRLEFSGTEVLLTRLLKELPNLKQLKLTVRSKFFGSVNPDFRLEKLEELTIDDPLPDILSYFKIICPQLMALKLEDYRNYRPKLDKKMVALIHGKCRTLKELKIYVSENTIDDLVGIEDLHLTRLAVDGSDENVLRMVKHQPDLEELEILNRIHIPIFDGFVSKLPKLKKLQVRIAGQNVQQTLSLAKLPSIETLAIRLGSWFEITNNQLLNLIDCNLTNVRDLSLYRCRLSSQVLSDLQQTNLSRLTLKNCSLSVRLSDLTLLKSLDHVELESNEYLSESDANKSMSPSVRSLKMVGATERELLAVAKIFPNLERFEAVGISYFGENFFLAMSQHSPLLKELRFGWECYFGIRDAVVHLPALKTISVRCKKRERESYINQSRGENLNVAVEFF